MTRAFAYMEGRIDPPSSLTRLTVERLGEEAAEKELWIIPGPLACVLLTPASDHLYIGKLAVDEAARGQGLARRMIDLAAMRARALGLPQLQLQTRVELTENQATFTHLGFRETGRTAHLGYDRPTSVTYQRDL
ncbi:GNAT family N-acetyltransferase [Pseudooceanicola sp.]|uniref:GNAT family N-acetyltransferase n=1 Tax=Pseudooceanicola sp. TaxID=1914328 RepID=UPI0035C6FE40